ncbi:serine/threonine protein kinase [Cohnella kolymensis]|uniref:serine/threonine protein kinase n=1 Tax=Cohnella kolymensis TaxID=1590652 RepID=UPI000696CBD1|nr:serine/threonine-protein kinase [Cohnella kolymensis]
MHGQVNEIRPLHAGELYADRYRIVMQIGKGGMGRVYLADDLRLGGKARALKLTRPLPEERRTFLPEAQMLCVLEHEHLPAVVDYYPPDEQGTACIVMEYIAGDTLAERFDRYGLRMPFHLVLRYLIQLCDVLVYLHAQSPAIVFRDLKPANVLIDRHDNAVLVDFGIARWYRTGAGSDTLQLGTPGFAAPEQLRGEQSDTRTDLYGLGALAYHLLSRGQFAMRRRGSLKEALQGDVPPAFRHLLEQVLSDQPEGRPQTAEQLSAELRRLLPDSANSDTPPINSHDTADSGVIVAAVASAYPGAGATFVSLAISSSLSRSGIAHAVVECPGIEAELYGLLDGSRTMPKGAVFAQAGGQTPAVPVWSRGKAHYYPLDPLAPAGHMPGEAFSSWLRRLGVPVVIVDVSSGWDNEPFMQWLVRAVDRIWMVADCMPAKWSARRQTACHQLQEAAVKDGKTISWIANRDQQFEGRRQWLSMFPAPPQANIPQLSSDSVASAIWRGSGLPTDAQTGELLDRAFQKAIRSVKRQA